MANLTPTNDIIFKKIFGSKGNEEILKDFLEAILDQKIEYVTLELNTELVPHDIYSKTSKVDVRARLEDKIEVNIEMQVKASDYNEARALQYWSTLYTSTIEKGSDYKTARKTICIWIIDGKVYNEFKEYHSKWKMTETKYGIIGHFDELEIHIIELKKFREADIIKPKKKEFWLWFIDHKQKELVKLNKADFEKILEAKRQLDEMTADENVRGLLIQMEMNERDEIMRRNRAIEEGRKEGMEKGMEKGKKEAAEAIAKSLKKKDMPVEDIMEVTGLTKEEIEKI